MRTAIGRIAGPLNPPSTFEIVGRPEELDAFEELVRPHGVRELVRTGRIGLRRPGSPTSQARQKAATVH